MTRLGASDEQRAAAKLLYETETELTERQIGERVGVTHTTVRRWAAQDGWVRGKLAEQAQKRSHARVATTNVPKKGSGASGMVPAGTIEQIRASVVLDETVVESMARVLTDVRLRQRDDVQRARNLVSHLLGEAERLSAHTDLFEMVGEMLFNPDKYGRDKLNELYQAVIQHPGRVKTVKDLADALGTMITLERGVFGLPAIEPPPPSHLKPPAGVLDTPQDTYRWLAGQRGVTLNNPVEDAKEVLNAAAR